MSNYVQLNVDLHTKKAIQLLLLINLKTKKTNLLKILKSRLAVLLCFMFSLVIIRIIAYYCFSLNSLIVFIARTL